MEHFVERNAEAPEEGRQIPVYIGLDTLSSGGTISVTEEVAGQRYIVTRGGPDSASWKTITTDVPHPAGYWEAVILNCEKSNLHIGGFFQKTGSAASLPVKFKLCSSWLGDASGIADRSTITSASFDPVCADPYLLWHNGMSRKIAPIAVPVVPAPSGTRLGFMWDPTVGVIYLFINGRRLGIFMSGLRGWDVYPAASFQYSSNSVQFSFNLALPLAA